MVATLTAIKKVALAVVAISCSTAVAAGTEVEIRSVNLAKDAYDAKEVTVQGYLDIGPEAMYVTTVKGYQDDFWQANSGCLSLLNVGDLGDERLVKSGALVKVTGIFKKSNYAYGISFSECGLTGLDIGGQPAANIHPVK